jgi:hypothetical protein
MPDFTSFNEFIDRTAAAKFEFYRDTIAAGLRHPLAAAVGLAHHLVAKVKKAASDDIGEEEFAKMKQYVLSFYKGIKDVKTDDTFVEAGGNFIDCVEYEQQPSYRDARKAGQKISTKPPKLRPASESQASSADSFGAVDREILPPLRAGLTDAFGKPLVCPEGRVPLPRITVGQMALLGKFENFFRKYPSRPESSTRARVKKRSPRRSGRRGAAPPPPFAGKLNQTEIHRHAVCEDSQAGAYFGCATSLNVWSVPTAPGVFNLSQLWILGKSTSGGVQTIESGWQTASFNRTPDTPAIFVFHTKNNYGQDPSVSGYFGRAPGFILQSSVWPIGTSLPGPYSSMDDEQYALNMQWEIDRNGAWWLFINGDAVGQFPAGFFPGTLAQSAQRVQFGGETCSQGPGTFSYPNTGPMGSGIPPSGTPTSDYGRVAYQKRILVKLQKDGDLDAAELNKLPADASYDIIPGVSSNPDWSSHFFYGGPRG